VDRTIMSAEQAKAMLENLARLRAAGLYRDALAYHDLGGLRVALAWEHDSKPATEVVASLDAGSPAAFPEIKKLLPDGYRFTPGQAITQWMFRHPPPRGRDPREDVHIQRSDRL
jgi:hypothetical protein